MEEIRTSSKCVILLRIVCFWKSCFSSSESTDFEQWSHFFHFYWGNNEFSFINQRKTIEKDWNIHFLKEWVLIQWYDYVFDWFQNKCWFLSDFIQIPHNLLRNSIKIDEFHHFSLIFKGKTMKIWKLWIKMIFIDENWNISVFIHLHHSFLIQNHDFTKIQPSKQDCFNFN